MKEISSTSKIKGNYASQFLLNYADFSAAELVLSKVPVTIITFDCLQTGLSMFYTRISIKIYLGSKWTELVTSCCTAVVPGGGGGYS